MVVKHVVINGVQIFYASYKKYSVGFRNLDSEIIR